jgi:hypothetical protein
LGASRVRLDTRHDLVEARRLYAKHGYLEIQPYSDNPYADHWFERQLGSARLPLSPFATQVRG